MAERILPVMRRTKLLPDSILAKFEAAIATNSRLRGVLMPLWLDAEQCLPCLAPRFLFQTRDSVEIFSWGVLAHYGADHPLLADLGMHLMSNSQLHTDIEEITNRLPVGGGQHYTNLIIQPGSLIMSHDDASAYVEDNAENFQSEPHQEATRAPFCTMFLRPNESAHEAIEEHHHVAHDLEIFRQMTPGTLHNLEQRHNLTLGDPTPNELQQVQPL